MVSQGVAGIISRLFWPPSSLFNAIFWACQAGCDLISRVKVVFGI